MRIVYFISLYFKLLICLHIYDLGILYLFEKYEDMAVRYQEIKEI